MVDLTEVTSQSWGSRLKGSIQGVVVGGVFAVGSVALLFWNEGRAVQRAKSLEEGAASVISVAPDAVSSANEGRLVHFGGRAETETTLSDPELGLRVDALRLFREVEMYQWKERVDSKTKKKTGGGTTTEKTYHYEKTWSSSPISSDSFKVSDGHRNPSFPFQSESWTAEDIHIGAFFLDAAFTGQLSDKVVLAVTDQHLAAVPEPLRSQLQVNSGTFYRGSDPASPQVGDVRVRFQIVRPGDASIVGRQKGDHVTSYTTRVGGEIALLDGGLRTADEMFQQAHSENKMLTWILRIAGFIVMFIGFAMIARPLSVAADVLPFLGNLVGAGAGIVAFLGAVMVSLVTIAVGWVVYRPLVGITLLAVGVGIAVLLFRMARRPAAVPPPPPPPPAVPPPPAG